MRLDDFIEVLKQFPGDADVLFGNEYMESQGDFLLGISAEIGEYHSQTYKTVILCILPEDRQNYDDLLDEKFELFGNNGVWYNTKDFIETYNNDHKPVRFFLDEETNILKDNLLEE